MVDSIHGMLWLHTSAMLLQARFQPSISGSAYIRFHCPAQSEPPGARSCPHTSQYSGAIALLRVSLWRGQALCWCMSFLLRFLAGLRPLRTLVLSRRLSAGWRYDHEFEVCGIQRRSPIVAPV